MNNNIDYSDNPLRGKSGAYLTQGLFYEFGTNRDALWTLRPEPIHGIPSMYQIYMDSADEYDFVKKTFKTMSHFRKLCDLEWFMEGYSYPNGSRLEGLKHWREDMRLRDESLAKKQLQAEAKNGNVTAMKVLHDTAKKGNTGVVKETKPEHKGRGRPSKVKEQVDSSGIAMKAYEALKQREGKLDA